MDTLTFFVSAINITKQTNKTRLEFNAKNRKDDFFVQCKLELRTKLIQMLMKMNPGNETINKLVINVDIHFLH